MQEKINRIRDYFKQFNVTETSVYVLAEFPEKWMVSGDICECGIQAHPTEKNNYYFFADMTEVEDATGLVFESVEKVVSFNKVIEERASLFENYLGQLKSIISNVPMDKLRTLKFVFGDDADDNLEETKESEAAQKGNQFLETIQKEIKSKTAAKEKKTVQATAKPAANPQQTEGKPATESGILKAAKKVLKQ